MLLAGHLAAAHVHHQAHKSANQGEIGTDHAGRTLERAVAAELRAHSRQLAAEERLLHEAAREVNSLGTDAKQTADVSHGFKEAEGMVARAYFEDVQELKRAERLAHKTAEKTGKIHTKRHVDQAHSKHGATQAISAREARIETGLAKAEGMVEKALRGHPEVLAKEERLLHAAARMEKKSLAAEKKAVHIEAKVKSVKSKAAQFDWRRSVSSRLPHASERAVAAREAHLQKGIFKAERMVANVLRGHPKELASEERLLHKAAEMAEVGATAEKRASLLHAKIKTEASVARKAMNKQTVAERHTRLQLSHRHHRAAAARRHRRAERAARHAKSVALEQKHREARHLRAARRHARQERKVAAASKHALKDLHRARAAAHQELGGTKVGVEVTELLREAEGAAHGAAEAHRKEEKEFKAEGRARDTLAKQLRFARQLRGHEPH